MIRKARLGNKGSNPGNSVLSNLTAELLGALRRDNEEKAFQVIERAISSGLDGPSIYLNVLQRWTTEARTVFRGTEENSVGQSGGLLPLSLVRLLSSVQLEHHGSETCS